MGRGGVQVIKEAQNNVGENLGLCHLLGLCKIKIQLQNSKK